MAAIHNNMFKLKIDQTRWCLVFDASLYYEPQIHGSYFCDFCNTVAAI